MIMSVASQYFKAVNGQFISGKINTTAFYNFSLPLSNLLSEHSLTGKMKVLCLSGSHHVQMIHP